jgi:hypothetical protein
VKAEPPLSDPQPAPPAAEDTQDECVSAYIYHPFTQRFINVEKGNVVGSEERRVWQILSFGKRRNGGFVRISC